MASISAELVPRTQLLRMLGLLFGLAVGVGTMIGGGILRTPGPVAQAIPSFWWIIGLWVFGGVHTLLGANLAAELFTSVPKAGGVYVPVRRAFGNFAAMLAGWGDTLSISAAIAALAIAGSEFLALAVPAAANWKIALAIALIGVVLTINLIGLREGRLAQILTTALKLTLLSAIIAAAMSLPSVPPPASVEPATAMGLVAILAAYQLVYGAYTGWTTPAYFVEEDVSPGRNIPRSLFFSVIAVTLVYVALNFAQLRAIPIVELGKLDLPVATLLEQLFGPAGSLLLGLTGFVIILSCLNGVAMQGPRIVYGLSRDGLFPRQGMLVNAGGTPWVGLLLVGIASLAMTATGSFEAAFRLMGALTVVIMIALDASLFMLRRREPDLDRPFRAWGYPLLPLLALLLDFGFAAAIVWFDPASGLITLALFAAAAMLWLATGRFRSTPLNLPQ